MGRSRNLFLILAVVTGVLWFFVPPKGTELDVSQAPGATQSLSASGARRNAPIPNSNRESAAVASSVPPLSEVQTAAETDSPDGTTHSDMSGQKEELFAAALSNSDEDLRRVEGTVSISYPGYTGKFRVEFLIPLEPDKYGKSQSFSIFLQDDENPTVNSLGGGSVDFGTLPGAEASMHFLGFSIHSFFKKKNTDAQLLGNHEIEQITGVRFHFNPAQAQGVSRVDVTFKGDVDGPGTTIGKFAYTIKLEKKLRTSN